MTLSDSSPQLDHRPRSAAALAPRPPRRPYPSPPEDTTTAIFGIAHVQLAITPGGEDAARAFYTGLLGLREPRKPESLRDRGGVWFQCGQQEIHCGIEDPVAPTRRHPAFLVDSVETLKASLESAGIPTETDRQLPGYRRFYALDPFGNRLEFLERE